MNVPIAPSIVTEPSSPDSFNEEDPSSHTGQWQQASPSSAPGSKPPRVTPLQKRRRVTRACDECRRKKIKCDGKQPCTHCTVYSYDCTYDQPSNRRRNPAPHYIEALENRLQRAETLLRMVLPEVDLNDPNIEAAIAQRQAGAAKTSTNDPSGVSKDIEICDAEQDSQLRSMITSTGQLDLDEHGRWDFHGGSSGTVFVRRMREQMNGLLGQGEKGAPFLTRLPRPYPSAMFNSPGSTHDSPLDSGLPNIIDLPSKETTLQLCDNSLTLACSLLGFVHQPSFYEMVDRIYNLPSESFSNEENQFLPLLYVVLALGCLFNIDESESTPEGPAYRTGIDTGLKYFRAARQMMDVTDCRDLPSLQAILFMILFLQSSANLSTCYSYIGIALRSSLRMGLHRNLTYKFNPIELQIRKRVFWIVRKMDTYVSAMLGFPQMLSLDDVDQELPAEVDDEFITKDGIGSMPEGRTSIYAASNAHTKLMIILSKVIKYIYPTKGLEQSLVATNPSYVISHAKIKEIEQDLKEWLDKLPMGLRPGGDASPKLVRIQQLLRLAYAHVQMMLYRPFLHYVSEKSVASKTKTLDERSYACAAACVSVSRNIVHITSEMKRRGFLHGAYWFTMYTTFFSILSLVFYVLENPNKAGSQEILADAMDGKEALDGLAKGSQAADRCSIAMKGLFEQLPAQLRENRGKASHLAKNKRPAASPPNEASQSAPFIRTPAHGDFNGPSISRARTFPIPAPTLVSPRSSLDGARLQVNTTSNPNLRQSFHELMTPSDLSTVGTPESSTSNYPHPQQFGINNSLPDLNAFMFPSNDPFAYPPNQPMIEYENVKQETTGAYNASSNPAMYMNNNPNPGVYDDLEGQIFGPLPPYLTQGAQSYDVNSEMDMGGGMMDPALNFHTGLTPGGTGDMNFVLSGENGGWTSMLNEQQRYRQQ